MNAEDFNESAATDKYLVYQLGREYFATTLTEIRSVIEFQTAKPIPHTERYYKGVINLRGQILGVVDLRERLGMVDAEPKPTCQLILDSPLGPIAAIVDRVLSVSVLHESDIDRKASVTGSAADRHYMKGVATSDGKILTLISLKQILERI